MRSECLLLRPLVGSSQILQPESPYIPIALEEWLGFVSMVFHAAPHPLVNSEAARRAQLPLPLPQSGG
jgi:hypothetical protein